jgi:hypothetical protein
MCMNVKFSSTRPTSRVNLLSLGCELNIHMHTYEGDSAEDKMSKF